MAYSENESTDKRSKNAGYDRLLTHAFTSDHLKHEVESNLDLIRYLRGIVSVARLELWIGEDDEAFADRILTEFGATDRKPLFAFAPSGGHSPLKQWPVDNFAHLGICLREQYEARFLVFGGDGEQELGCEIEKIMGASVINLVGKTTLRQMAGLLKRCHLFVGNDAGPMHVASAMNIPVVALFGSSCYHRFAPWNEPHRMLNLKLPCHPCLQKHHTDRCVSCIFDEPRCMRELTINQVKEAVDQFLGANHQNSQEHLVASRDARTF